MTELAERLAGKFIVLDGPDGSGKSTQLKLLAEFLRGRSVSVVETRDPGGTTIGEQIRRVLLDRAHTEMTIGCEILLYMASRAQLMGEVIAPAMREGKCVLCDRWVSSTIAYQVAGDAAGSDEIMEIYRLALGDVGPDLTIIVDVETQIGLARARGAAGHDRMEAKGVEFHDDVRRLFLHQVEVGPGPAVVVDGSGSIEHVHGQIVQAVEGWEFEDGSWHT